MDMLNPDEPLPSPLALLYPERRHRGSGSKGSTDGTDRPSGLASTTMDESVIMDDDYPELPSTAREAFSSYRDPATSEGFPLSLPPSASPPNKPSRPGFPVVSSTTSSTSASSFYSASSSFSADRATQAPWQSTTTPDLVPSTTSSTSLPSLSTASSASTREELWPPTPEKIASSPFAMHESRSLSGGIEELRLEASGVIEEKAKMPTSLESVSTVVPTSPVPTPSVTSIPSSPSMPSLHSPHPSATAAPRIPHSASSSQVGPASPRSAQMRKSPSHGKLVPLSSIDLPPSMPVVRLSSEDFARLASFKSSSGRRTSGSGSRGQDSAEGMRRSRSKPPVTGRKSVGSSSEEIGPTGRRERAVSTGSVHGAVRTERAEASRPPKSFRA